MSQDQWLIFHLYDLDARTFEETVWREWDSAEALVQEWKDKGHRLVLEGYVIDDPIYSQFPRFVPAGEMQRIWSGAQLVLEESWPPPIGTWLFIWETGSTRSGGDAMPDDESVTR